MLANTSRQGLIDHLNLVALLAEKMAHHIGLSDSLCRVAYYAGKYHDIGKATKSFQDNLQRNMGNFDGQYDALIVDDLTAKFNGPYHHEISWAICETMKDELFAELKIVDGRKNRSYHSMVQMILNAVYWHHPQPKIDLDNTYPKARINISEITSNISDEDNKSLFDTLSTLSGLDVEEIEYVSDATVPNFFHRFNSPSVDNNHKMILIRACVISADRTISALDYDSFNEYVCGKNISDLIVSDIEFSPIEFTKPLMYEEDRYNIQLKCATDSLTHPVALSNSPAGFGKTLQALLRNLISGGRTYWVCPRNIVALSVYQNIISELNNLGIDIPVELNLTSGTNYQNNHNGAFAQFSSRIVVTNIDSILNSFHRNDILARSYQILSSDMVFDEYHEFVTDEALFAQFISTMKARIMTNCKSFLLSATPSITYKLWETGDFKTKFLPDKGKHFPSAHNKHYFFTFDSDINSVKIPTDKNILIKRNSIKNTANYARGNPGHIVFHSLFYESDRNELTNRIFDIFGKSGNTKGSKVASAPIIGASSDISFDFAVIDRMSPEEDLQVMGRVNRWGREDQTNVTFLKSLSKSDRSAVANRYDEFLADLWYDEFRKEFNNRNSTLDELYAFYNKFNEKHELDILNWINGKCDESYGHLTSGNYSPVKLPSEYTNSSNKNGKSLRSHTSQHYITVMGEDGEFGEVFSLSRKEFISKNGKNSVLSSVNPAIIAKSTGREIGWDKLLAQLSKNSDFDYSVISTRLKNPNRKEWDKFILEFSQNPRTPYPVLKWRYSKEFGLDRDFV